MKRCMGILLLLLLVSVPLSGQDGHDDDDVKRRVDDLRRIRLIEALDLTEEQSVRLFAREREHRDKEAQHIKLRKQLLDELESSLAAQASDEVITDYLERLHAANLDINKSRYDYVASLKDFLSVQQVGRLVLFEFRFMQEVRNIIKRSRKGPPSKSR
jgi:hypothetical protein